MANLDTVSKRASGFSILSFPTRVFPVPDGTIDQGDRQHIAFSYSGILAIEVVFVNPVYLLAVAKEIRILKVETEDRILSVDKLNRIFKVENPT